MSQFYQMGSETQIDFVELYDLQSDPAGKHNLATDPPHATLLQQLNRRLDREIEKVARHR